MNEEFKFSLKELLLISHSLGIDLFKAVISLKKKDKLLPSIFYRNYFNTGKDSTDFLIIKNLVENSIMDSKIKDYYFVTEKGIALFKDQFESIVIYKPNNEKNINYLKHRINFYCDFYGYKFNDYDNSEYIFRTYKDYKYVKKFYVSHITKHVILMFKNELKRYLPEVNVLFPSTID